MITQITGFIELESHHRPGVGGFSHERVKRTRVVEQSRWKTWRPSVPYFFSSFRTPLITVGLLPIFLRDKITQHLIGGIYLEAKIQFNRAGFGARVCWVGPRGNSVSVLEGQGAG